MADINRAARIGLDLAKIMVENYGRKFWSFLGVILWVDFCRDFLRIRVMADFLRIRVKGVVENAAVRRFF